MDAKETTGLLSSAEHARGANGSAVENGKISFGRWLARLLFKTSDDDNDSPSIEEAWERFECTMLPRHFTRNNNNGALTKSPIGSSTGTELYSVWSTPEKELGDFGIGVGIYFWTLKWLSFILLVGGILSIPSMKHYRSSGYDSNVDAASNLFLRSSAECSEFKWAACPTCTADQWMKWPSDPDQYASTEDGKLHFIVVNQCSTSSSQFWSSYASLIFVSLSVFALLQIARRREAEIDEAAQTTSDYSIKVENPPPDAYDPEEWKSIFSQYGKVVAVTVAVDNEELTRILVKRRTYRNSLYKRLPIGFKPDKHNLKTVVDSALPLAWYEKLMLANSPDQLYAKILKLDAEMEEQDLMKKRYPVSNVFVTFDTETSQREALSKSSMTGFCKLEASLEHSLVGNDDYILEVSEPPEPDSIRWFDLDESLLDRMRARILSDSLTIIFIIFDCLFLINVRRVYGASMFGFAVTGMGYVSFYTIIYLVNLESHESQGSRQSSLFLKLTLFRWFNTAIMTSYITPFTEYLSTDKDSMLNSLFAIFFYEILKGPVMQLLNPSGNLKKFVLAPRAKDQDTMNAYFRGKYWDLAERYTDMTSIVFLTLYYSVLFPAGFFLGAIALILHYWTDKYCLLRVWAMKPALGNATAQQSRIFLWISIFVFAVMSSYSVSSFPYDNACSENTPAPSSYVGSFKAINLLNKPVFPTINAEDESYRFCDQFMLSYILESFPPVPDNASDEWMAKDQKFAANLFGLTVYVIFAVVFLYLLYVFIRSWCCNIYEPSGKASNTKFSWLKVKTLYIPQQSTYGDRFPLLLTDSSNLTQEYVGWKDELESYEEYCVLFDIRELAEMVKSERNEDEEKVLGSVNYWPPGK